MTTPEIFRVESDVVDPAGNDTIRIFGRLLNGASAIRLGVLAATGITEPMSAAADFNGTNNILAPAATLTTFFDTSAYSGWVLVKIGRVKTNAGAGSEFDNDSLIATQPSAYFQLYMRSSGVIGIRHFDNGAVANIVTTTLPTLNDWHLVHWRYDGTNLAIGVDGTWGTPVAVGTLHASGLASNFKIGTNYDGTKCYTGRLAELAMTNYAYSEAALRGVLGYVNKRYGLALGGIAPSTFDPTTLVLQLYCRAGGYVSGTWTATATAGGSAGRNLTELTNPPSIADSDILICTTPVLTAGQIYPVSVKTVGGWRTLPNAVKAATPKDVLGVNCQAWYKGSVGVSTDLPGNVTSWADQSGTGDANKNAPTVGADHPSRQSADVQYGGKGTVGPCHYAGNFFMRTGVWASPLSADNSNAYWIGIYGHTRKDPAKSNYFTSEAAGQYNAVLGSGEVPTGYMAAAQLIGQTGGDDTAKPRSFIGVRFKGVNSQIRSNRVAPANGGAGATTLGGTGLSIGCWTGGATETFGVDAMAEVVVANTDPTTRQLRDILRYFESSYGPQSQIVQQLYVSSYACNALWQAPFTTIPWTGSKSAGASSATRSLDSGASMATGNTLAGQASARFNGTSSYLANVALPVSSLITTTAYFYWVLFYFRGSLHANSTNPAASAYANEALWGDAGGFVGCALATGPVVMPWHYHTGGFGNSHAIVANAWNLIVVRYDGTNIRSKLFSSNAKDAIVKVSAAAGSVDAVAGAIQVGKNFNGGAFTGSDIAEIGFKPGAGTDADMDDVAMAVNNRWGIYL
jgi:hypothetical protein